MFENRTIGAMLLMGGNGDRFENKTPKQFLLLGKKPLYKWALHTFQKMKIFDQILLVCHPDWIDQVNDKKVKKIEGGNSRQESSFLGITSFSPMPDIILIHDAVRPFVSKEIILENIKGALQFGAVDTCIPSNDTLVFSTNRKTIESIPNRTHFLRGQTPQTARSDWLLNAHNEALAKKMTNTTDDCKLLLEAGYPVHIVIGSDENFKITVNLDLILAKRIHKKKRIP